jgi:serine/threonine protein kinase
MGEQYRCRSCGDVFSSANLTCPTDGSSNVDLLKPGLSLFGPYTYQSILGQGGMGMVYKANHSALNRSVAIKMLKVGRLATYDVRRFQKEGQAVSRLSHPSIVHVHDLGVTPEGLPFMVMDLVDGISLKDLIEERGALLLSETVDIGLQISDAMQHAHSNGIIHRDLKPSNIMLVPVGYDHFKVKIVDFGIAKVDTAEIGVAATLTNTGEILGSPAYMSPEQAKGIKIDGATDIYSVGCILFECLTGAPPFSGNNIFDVVVQHINQTPPPLSEASMGRNFPASIEKLVSTSLAKESVDRFPNFTAMSHALESIASGNFEGHSFGDHDTNNGLVGFIKKQKFALISVFVLLVLCGSLFGFNAFKTTAMTDSKVGTSDIDHLRREVEVNKFVHTKNETNADKNAKAIHELTPEDMVLGSSVSLVDQLQIKQMDQIEREPKEEDRFLQLGSAMLTKPVLEHLSLQTRLLGLSIIDSQMGNTVIPYIVKLPLQELDLGGTKITDKGLSELRSMKTLQKLNIRDINGNRKSGTHEEATPHRITLFGFNYLAEMPLLRSLDLTGDFLADEDLSFLPRMNQLKTLILHPHQQITPACCRYIGGIKRLRRLQVNGTPITLHDIVVLKNFPQLQQLEFSDFSRHLNPKDVVQFMSQSKELEILDLTGIAFDSAFVRGLAALPNLTKLQVISPKVTVADKQYLEKMLPGCHIDFRAN